MNLTTQLRSLEELLLSPSTRANATQLSALLADDFVEFGSSGRIFTRSAIISELNHESPRQLSLENFQAFPLSPEIVLVTYASTRVADGETSSFLRSSIWVNQAGTWKLRFHQGTRQAGSPEVVR